jgi:hypothetical protein
MKTIPLDELLKQTTPLPWHVDYSGPARLGITAANDVTVALGNLQSEDGDTDEANVRYLAHAANLLPEFVTALRQLSHLAQQHDPKTGFYQPPDPYAVTQITLPLLAKAAAVPVPDFTIPD